MSNSSDVAAKYSIGYAIFNWGTLADTYPAIIAGYNEAFRTLGIEPFTEEKIKHLTRVEPDKNILFETAFGKHKEQAREIFYKYIIEHHLDNLSLFPGANDVLKFCENNNIKCYLISGKTNTSEKPFLRDEVKKLGLETCFEKILGAGEAERDVPSELAMYALFDDDLPDPEETVVVGKGKIDYLVAKECFSTPTPIIICNPEGIYTSPRPNYMITNLSEVIEIFKREFSL